MRKALPGLFGLVLVALVGWMIYAQRAGDAVLDRSVLGADGLQIWLRANDVAVTRTNPRLRPVRDDLSIVVVPLYDTDLSRTTPRPATDDERMAQTDLRDHDWSVLDDTLYEMTTLVVLPKWRQGFALTGIAHEQTQVAPADLSRLLGQTPLRGASLLAVENRMTSGPVANLSGVGAREVALFRAQLLDPATLPEACRPMATLGGGALVVACRQGPDRPVAWFLSDPDLLNNHGLALADNAGFALALVQTLRGQDTRPVLLMTHPVWLVTPDEPLEPHERTAEDLSRFFAWPLSALWLMGGAVLGLAVWRGARRFGPAQGRTADAAVDSRRAAIEAKARLLRLSGADARMVGEHARAHLADMAAQALGPGSGNDAGVTRWLALLARRNPDLARDLRDAAEIPPDTTAAELPRRLATLHALTRKAQDAA